jgi:hypothetical protein
LETYVAIGTAIAVSWGLLAAYIAWSRRSHSLDIWLFGVASVYVLGRAAWSATAAGNSAGASLFGPMIAFPLCAILAYRGVAVSGPPMVRIASFGGCFVVAGAMGLFAGYLLLFLLSGDRA